MKSKSKKPCNNIIDSSEFEGLVSFEEVNSVRLASAVIKNGKSSLHIKKLKKGKVPKIKNKQQKKNITITKPSNSNKKNTSTVEDPVHFDIDNSAWTTIFTPSLVINALTKLGFSRPSEIQEKTIPAAIKGKKDIIGAAETGSGKTLAFGIPIIDGILRMKERERLNLEAADKEDKLLNKGGDENDEINSDEEENLNCEDDKCSLSESSENEDDNLSDDNDDDDDDDDDECSLSESIENEEENLSCEDEEEMEVDEHGIGCVKVIDNAYFDFLPPIDMPINDEGKLYALIVTPTRELAVQIKNHLDAILTYTSIKTAVVIGGLSEAKQDRVLNKHPEIVIGTPGRLWEMFVQGNKHLAKIPEIRFLAIDETDRMMEAGHFEELKNILEILNKNDEYKKKRQTFVFSATLTFTFDPPKRLLAGKKKVVKITADMKIENIINLVGMKSKPKIVDITRKFGTAETLSEAKIFCDQNDKDDYLYYFLKKYPGRTLVFCNSINCVRRLTNLLTVLRCQPKALHASKQQKQRMKNLETFTKNENCTMIATDVAARGIDIPDINHVVHYELPRTVDTYIHRSGRTARSSKKGLSVMLIDSNEINKYKQFCSSLNRPAGFNSMPIVEETLQQIMKSVQIAKEIETMEFVVKKQKLRDNWQQTMAEAADIMIDDSDSDQDEQAWDALQKRKETETIKLKRMQLKKLMAAPFQFSSYAGKFPVFSNTVLNPSEHKNSALDSIQNIKSFKKSNNSKALNTISTKGKITKKYKKKRQNKT